MKGGLQAQGDGRIRRGTPPWTLTLHPEAAMQTRAGSQGKTQEGGCLVLLQFMCRGWEDREKAS